MPNFNDVQDYIKRQRADAFDARRSQLRSVASVGRYAQMVLDHPAWQSYVDHVGALRDAAEQERADIVKEMSDGNDFGDKLSALKLQLKEVTGRLTGYTQALELIPELIKRAEIAAVDLRSAS